MTPLEGPAVTSTGKLARQLEPATPAKAASWDSLADQGAVLCSVGAALTAAVNAVAAQILLEEASHSLPKDRVEMK